MRLHPSRATIKAAETDANSRHALINLTRLVHSLKEKEANDVDGDEDEQSGDDWIELNRDWETALYARALLEAIRGSNEQSSSASVTLDDLSNSLYSVEDRYRTALQKAIPKESTPLPDLMSPSIASLRPQSNNSSFPLPSPPLQNPPTLRQRHSSTLSISPSSTRDYLKAREAEDARGDEAGLLPLKVVPSSARGGSSLGDRDSLLGGAKEVNSLGSAQLHDELGGQLAEMSHRLKLNALHFASSLEEEKTLLDQSQGVLEKNLSSTRSSKAQLALVTKKGRGTTCLTLGVVGLVIVLWVWMYMLIRFT